MFDYNDDDDDIFNILMHFLSRIIYLQLGLQVVLSNTNNLHMVVWFQVFLIQMICTQLCSIKYSYLIQIICILLYGIKYS